VQRSQRFSHFFMATGFTIYGEEVKFGGGKVIRDGMGQSQRKSGEGINQIAGFVIEKSGIAKLRNMGDRGRAGSRHGRRAPSRRSIFQTGQQFLQQE
jgi:urease alpha subunit-like protein